MSYQSVMDPAIHASIDKALAAMKQKSRVAADPTIPIVTIAVGPSRTTLKRVDPLTHLSTSDVQQFRLTPGGTLTILPKSEWIAHPTEICVDRMSYR